MSKNHSSVHQKTAENGRLISTGRLLTAFGQGKEILLLLTSASRRAGMTLLRTGFLLMMSLIWLTGCGNKDSEKQPSAASGILFSETGQESHDISGASTDPDTQGDALSSGSKSPAIPETFITDIREEPSLELVRTADSFDGITPTRFGDAGALLIPSIGINVRLFRGSDENDAYNQQGVDFEDSAGLLNWGGEDVIGDHSNQGFSAIGACIPGETSAYIVQEDHSYREYLCVDLMDGTNDLYHLYGNDGHDYMHDSSARCDLVMYTCLETWEHIQLVLWAQTE